MNSKPIYIVDELADVIAATDAITFPLIGKHINYMYGHPIEIISRLQELTSATDMTLRASKYPLVALFQDFKEQMGIDSGIYSKVTMNIIIANITEQNYNSTQRYQKNFKPILYPIYQELLNQLDRAKNTFIENPDKIQHTKIDRVFWGKTGLYTNSGNVFNDYLDCIELQNLEVSFYNKYF